jgi:RNA polymerase sigma factor (sigma-70 family)
MKAGGEAGQIVYVIDDDSSTRELLAWLMRRNAIDCETFADPRAFLAAYKPADSACLILDLYMPGMTGLDLQRTLKEQGVDIPVIFLSGRADVPQAVEAVKGGAYDFIEKPFDYKRVVELVRECLASGHQSRAQREKRRLAAERLAHLTQREREVMDLVVAGQMNREIAERLEISIKTVEAHRARLMEKLAVNSVAELVQVVMESKGPEGAQRR